MSVMPEFCVAAARFKLVRDPEDHMLDPEIPDEIAVAHALPRYRTPPTRHGFMDPWPTKAGVLDFAEQAMCGRQVRVIYPMRFRADDPVACPWCVRRIESGAVTPDRVTADERRARARRQKLDTMLGEAPELDDDGNFIDDGPELP